MKMIRVRQGRAVWIAPSFSVEMQAKHKIRMQFEVNQCRAASNLAVAIEQNFALPANRLLFFRIIRIKNVGARLWHAVLDQNFSSKLPKIIGALRRNRFVATSDERNFCTEVTQSRGQESRDAQSQIAFLDGLAVAHLKPTFLHLCPLATEMTRVERDP